MKPIVIIVSLCSLMLSAFSQNSKPLPFPEDSPLWVMWTTYPFMQGDTTSVCSYYSFIGDTTIEDKNYSKIVLLNDTVVSVQNIDAYVGAIRQEGDSIFVRNLSEPSEKLIMDYSRGINDTLFFDSSFYDYVIIQDIDTIDLNDGSYRRYTTNCGDQWIEGIGNADYSLFDICQPRPDDGSHTVLYSFKLENNYIYGSNSICPIITDIEGIPFIENCFRVYPCPSFGDIYIDTQTDANKIKCTLEINELSGKLVIQRELDMSSGHQCLDIRQLGNGIYLLVIRSKSEVSHRELLIKY